MQDSLLPLDLVEGGILCDDSETSALTPRVTPCLLDSLLGKETRLNEGLQDLLLPPDLKNTIAPGLVS